jgi:HlyD family secretion protein
MKEIVNILLLALLGLTACKRESTRADAYGNFEAVEVILAPEVQGRILTFKAGEGDPVKKGQVIAEIDSTQLCLKKEQLESGRASLRAGISTLEAQVRANRVQMDNLLREKDRVNRLLEGGAATTKQKEDLEGQVELLSAQIEALETQKASVYTEQATLEIQIRQVEDQITRCRIRSPQNGRILLKYREEGELAAPGQPLCKIADLETLLLRAYVSGNQLASVKIGSRVHVGVDNGGELKEIPGTVTWVASEAEFTPKLIQTREERVNLVYAIKVKVANDGSLKIGMPGEVYIRQGQGHVGED